MIERTTLDEALGSYRAEVDRLHAERDRYRAALGDLCFAVVESDGSDEAERRLDAALEQARALNEERPCPTCGGRGWHTAGGNDPAACGRCPAGEAWASAENQERQSEEG